MAQRFGGVVVEGDVGSRAQGRADGRGSEDACDGDAVILGLCEPVAGLQPGTHGRGVVCVEEGVSLLPVSGDCRNPTAGLRSYR